MATKKTNKKYRSDITLSLAKEAKPLKRTLTLKEQRSQQELLNALQELSVVLTAEVDIQKILADMAKILARAIGAKWVNFWQLTPNKDGVYIVAYYGMSPSYAENSRKNPIRVGTAWIGRAVKTRKAWGTSDALADTKLHEVNRDWVKSIQKQGVRALLCLPLLSGKRTVGGMCVYFTGTHKFSDFEMRLMTVAANQAATSITNAEIFNELRAERNKTISVLNSLYDGIIAFDLEEKIITFNPRAEELLWVKRSDVLSRRPADLDSKANELLKNVQTIASLTLVSFEPQEVVLEEPRRIYLRVMSLPVADAQNKKIATMRVLHDITQEKQTEQLRSSFVSVASHQLRTPLSAFKWAIDLLIHDEYGPLNPKQKSVLSMLALTTDHLVLLIKDLLDVSKIESGQFGYEFSQQDLWQVIQGLAKDLSAQIASSKVQFILVPPADSLPKISCDLQKIKIAILNLIDNALKYTLPGGKVTVSLSRGISSVVISVADTGIGIPKEQQGFLFTKFFRARNAIRVQAEGSGLGLWITNEIVRGHNGRITVESVEGKGSTFSIQLPLKSENMPQGKVAPAQPGERVGPAS